MLTFSYMTTQIAQANIQYKRMDALLSINEIWEYENNQLYTKHTFFSLNICSFTIIYDSRELRFITKLANGLISANLQHEKLSFQT